MGFWELTMIGIGLAMDAFAVSVGKGLSVKRAGARVMLACGFWFGGFQFLMPVAGYFAGHFAAALVDRFDHWIGFILLAFIGGKMIVEAIGHQEALPSETADLEKEASIAPGEMAMLAVATSIDALAVGVTFAFLDVAIFPAAAWIGILTFLIAAAGVKLGSFFGDKLECKAEIVGGVILIIIGIRILLSGLHG